MSAALTLLLGAAFVQILWIGYALSLAGYTRARNAANLLMMTFSAYGLAVLLYWAVGAAFAEGRSAFGLLGTNGFFLIGEPRNAAATLRWWSRATLTAFAASILTGAIMGRVRFAPALLALAVGVGFLFPMVQHWIWGDGWLARRGALDFAGATTIHLAAGTVGLVGAALLGPRFGRYTREGIPNAFPAHNLPLSATGVALLAFGWVGYHFVRALEVGGEGLVVRNTLLGFAGGGFAAMFLAWGRYGKPDVTLTLNGMVAGLVSISGIANATSDVAALAIGAIGGILSLFGTAWLDRWQVDDPGGIIPAHGLGGLWGTIAVGLLHADRGLLIGGGVGQLGAQLLAAAAVVFVVGVISAALFAILLRYGRLRPLVDEELVGLDAAEHANDAYADFQRVEFK